MYYAHLLIILQRPEEAVVQAQLAYELDPLDPVILILYSVTFVCADDCENATLYAEKALNLDPENFMANEHIGEVAFHCGDYDTAFEIDKLVFQGYSQGQFGEDVLKEIDGIFQEQGYFAAYEKLLTYYEILADKGLIGPGMMAVNYVIGNQKENALDWLEIAYEIRDPQMPYITSGCYPFDILYGYPRFIAIVKKMNLPLP
jgi:tetratricopeptide (TPR) repeat protein